MFLNHSRPYLSSLSEPELAHLGRQAVLCFSDSWDLALRWCRDGWVGCPLHKSAPLTPLAKVHLDQCPCLLHTKGLGKASKAPESAFCIDSFPLLLEQRGPILGTSSPKLKQWEIQEEKNPVLFKGHL